MSDAFFEFGTNAPEVAKLIEGALSQIRAVYGQTGSALASQNANTTFLDDLVGKLRGQVERANAELAQLGNVRVAGGADARRALFSDVAQGISRTLQEAQATVSRDLPALRTFDFGQLGREALADVESKLRTGSYSKTQLSGVLKSFEGDIAQLDEVRDRAQQAIIERLRTNFARLDADALANPIVGQTLTARQRLTLADPEQGGARAVASSLSYKQLTSLVGGGVIEPFTAAEAEREARRAVAGVNRQAIAAEKAAAAEEKAALAAEEKAAAERRAADALALERRLLADPTTVRPSPSSPYLINQGQVYQTLAQGGARLVEGDAKRLGILAAQEATMERQAAAQAKQIAFQNRSPLNAFTTGLFSRSFDGDGGVPNGQTALSNLAQTAGSAVRYSLAYGAVFALQGVLRDTLNEALDFTDSFTDLQVAVKDADLVTDDWINSLEDLARVSGTNVGAAIDAAARGVRGFVDDVAAADAATIESAGTAIAKSSNQLALIAGKDAREATGDIIAIGQAFQLTAEQSTLVVDAISSAKQLGAAPVEIANGLAGIGTTAKEAGFTLQETANLVSAVTAQTDQTGVAAATRFSRIFSILSGSTGESLLGKLDPIFRANDIDPGNNLKDQLYAIGQVYNDIADKDLQGLIRNQLGGTANTRELIAFFDSLEKIKDAEIQAGAGAAEFARKSNDLVGTIRKIQGSLTGIQTGIVRSGLLQPIGIGIKVLEQGLGILQQFIQAYNELTSKVPGLQTAVAVLVEGALALKAFQAIRGSGFLSGGGSGGIVSRLFGGPRLAAENAFASQITAAGVERVAAETAVTGEVTAAGQALAAALARTAGAAAIGGEVRAGSEIVSALERPSPYAIPPTSPYAIPPAGAAANTGLLARAGAAIKPYGPLIAVAGAIGAFDLVNTAIENQRGVSDFRRTTSQTLTTVSSTDDLRAAADALDSSAASLAQAQSGFFSFTNTSSRNAAIDSAGSAADFLRAQQERIDYENRFGEALSSTAVFGDPAARGVEELAAGMEELATNGVGAARSLRILINAITEKPKKGEVAVPKLEGFAQNFINAFNGSVGGALETGVDSDGLLQTTIRTRSSPRASIGAALKLTPDAVQERFFTGLGDSGELMANLRATFLDELQSQGYQQGDFIDKKTLKAVVSSVLTRLGIDFSLVEDGDKIRQEFIRQIVSGDAGIAPTKLRAPSAKLSDTQITERVNQLVGSTSNSLSVQTTDAGRARVLRSSLDALDVMARRAVDGTVPRSLLEARSGFVSQLADVMAAEFEQDRKRIVATSSSKAEANRRTQRAARQTLLALARLGKGSEDQVLALMEAIGRRGVQAVVANLRKIVQDARAAYQAALIADQASRAAAASASHELGRIISATPEASSAYDELVGAKNALDRFKTQQDRAALTDNSSLADDYGSAGSSAADAASEAAALFAAKANAVAAKQGTALAQAKADLQIAQYNLNNAKAGTSEYYDALAAYYQAQDALDDAIRAQQAARLNARAALQGGSLNQARAALIIARQALRAEEEGTTEYFEALATFRQAQASLSDAILQDAQTRAQLRTDITDPIAQARIELRLAERKLKRDLAAGKDQQTIREDKLGVKQAATGLEQTKFDEFLSDLQTQEQLGQITFQQYTKYLEAERRRLQQIRHKTEQQQDQLDQINLLLKQASESMEGQFNLGSIKLPTVYQARRFMEENIKRINGVPYGQNGPRVTPTSQTAAAAERAGASQSIINSGNTVNIHGADLREVKRLVIELIGPARVNGTSTRKVG